jgi:hypothetical protein
MRRAIPAVAVLALCAASVTACHDSLTPLTTATTLGGIQADCRVEMIAHHCESMLAVTEPTPGDSSITLDDRH